MTKDKVWLLSELQKVHDEIKNHPFRASFSEDDIPSFKNAMYYMTQLWSDLAYRVQHDTDEEVFKYRQFCGWIHDYRQVMRSWDKKTFDMRYFDYFEQMLQVTHTYLNTGYMDVFYNPDTIWDKDGNRYESTSSRYEWITEEMCGIKSTYLPGYLCTSYRYNIDDEDVKQYILIDWYRPHMTDGEKLAEFDKWKKEIKPVLEWVHKTYSPDNEHIHPVWKSTRTGR